MLNVVLFMIVSFWMSSIIVEQKVFQEVREYVTTLYDTHVDNFFLKKLCQLISCVVCTGFWCGAFLTWTGFDVFGIHPYWDIFYGALLGSFGSYVGLIATTVVEAALKIKYGIEI